MISNQQEVYSPVVRRKYGGKWVAWDCESDRIIASSDTLNDLIRVAPQLEEDDFEIAYQWIPPSDVRLVGTIL